MSETELVATMRDFFRFIGRLLRDGYLISLVIFDVLYFGASWIASSTDRFRIPQVPSSGYLVLFLVGVIIAAYRNELWFRAELEAVQARAKSSDQTSPDLLMDLRTFEMLVKPKKEREGYDLKLPVQKGYRCSLLRDGSLSTGKMKRDGGGGWLSVTRAVSTSHPFARRCANGAALRRAEGGPSWSRPLLLSSGGRTSTLLEAVGTASAT